MSVLDLQIVIARASARPSPVTQSLRLCIGDELIRSILRRLGILVFGALSFRLWSEVAYTAGAHEVVLLAGPRTMLMGACLACLVALMLSELASWARRAVESTRRECMLADPGSIFPAAPNCEDPDRAWLHKAGGNPKAQAAGLETEAGIGRRAWTAALFQGDPEVLKA